MTDGGAALMSIGVASGEERALAAANQAIQSPLLDLTISGAKGVLFNVRGGEDMALFEVNEVGQLIHDTASPDANIIFGAMIDPDMDDQIQVTVIATGFDLEEAQSSGIRLPRRESSEQGATANQPFPNLFDNSDLDIPPFLRRS